MKKRYLRLAALGTSYGTVPAISGQITLVHKIASPGQKVTNRYGFSGIF